MIRSVLTLHAANGNMAAIEDFYAEHDVIARSLTFPGCRDSVLMRSVSGTAPVHLVIADWDSAADYQRWTEDPWRDAVSRQLAALLDTGSDEPVVGGVFEFVPSR